MFGGFRLFLALLVASSHILPAERLNQGVVAVVGFYLLSGYLMALVFSEVFKGKLSNLGRFYMDRGLRIWPMYLVFLGFGWWVVNLTNGLTWRENWWSWIAQVTILPLNYYNSLDLRVMWETSKPLIPQAWSLASELHFYLLLPILVNRNWLRRGIMGASLMWFVVVGVFVKQQADVWGYVVPPASMWVFISGIEIYRWLKCGDVVSKKIVFGVWVAMVVMLMGLDWGLMVWEGRGREMILGCVIWLPVIVLLAQRPRGMGWDRTMGDVAYGIFLNHVSVYYLLMPVEGTPGVPTGIGNFWKVILVSLGLSWLGVVLIERPIARWRRSLRRGRR